MEIRRSSFIFLVFLFGCLEPIEVITINKGGELIISGQISTLEDQSVVTIGTTAETERLPFPVSDAIVVVYENNDSLGTFIEHQTTKGKYVLKGHAGKPGSEYYIKVTLPDNETYLSAAEKMPDDAGSVTSYYELAREDFVDGEGTLSQKNLIKIYANGVLPSADNQFFRWTVDEVYIIVASTAFGSPFTSLPCFVSQPVDPQTFELLNRQNISAVEVPNKFVAQRIVDQTFLYKHYFVTYQSALTAEAYDYWRKVDVLITGNGSLFDPPPAKIFGNIRGSEEQEGETPYGYFQVVNQTVHRIYTNRSDFPYFLNFADCEGTVPPPRCTNCLSVRNSSYDRPPWF